MCRFNIFDTLLLLKVNKLWNDSNYILQKMIYYLWKLYDIQTCYFQSQLVTPLNKGNIYSSNLRCEPSTAYVTKVAFIGDFLEVLDRYRDVFQVLLLCSWTDDSTRVLQQIAVCKWIVLLVLKCYSATVLDVLMCYSAAVLQCWMCCSAGCAAVLDVLQCWMCWFIYNTIKSVRYG